MKCKNILDFDFVNEKASNISPGKLSNEDKNQQGQNSSSNKKSDYIRKYDESSQHTRHRKTYVCCMWLTLANSSTRLAPKVIFLGKSQVMT